MWQSLCPLEETPHIGGVRWECSRVLGEGISWSEGRSPLLITRVRGRERRGTNALDELRGGGALWGCGGRVACGGWVVRGVGRECQQHPLDEGEHIKALDGQFHTKYRSILHLIFSDGLDDPLLYLFPEYLHPYKSKIREMTSPQLQPTRSK